MDELLARWTDLPIHQAENNLRIERDRIYLLPPRMSMVIAGGCLLLTDKDPDERLTFPIDHFFRSLAQDIGPRAIAVVLSGTGTDGSRGIRDVHEAGGLVIAQREETAKFDGMPRSARDSGLADLFLSPEEIPDALERFAANPTASTGISLGEQSEESKVFGDIFSQLKDSYEIDFGLYKPSTVDRRIRRRMMLSNVHTLPKYLERLQSDALELELLYKDLLIGVTSFFRDSDAFRKLADVAVKELIDEAVDGEDIRIWVTACATGEEAYSIAILFSEALESTTKNVQVKIFCHRS